MLQAWLTERGGPPSDPLFPGPSGRPLSRDAIRRLVDRHVATAAQPAHRCRKTVTPHTLRHSCAMTLSRPAWTPRRSPCGSATPTSDHHSVYLHADLNLKEKALARTAPPAPPPGRYRPPDTLLAFLEACEYADPHRRQAAATPDTRPPAPHIPGLPIGNPVGLAGAARPAGAVGVRGRRIC